MPEISMITVWLILLVVFVVGEVATAGLVSIWFCFGALASMIVAAVGIGTTFQIIVFFVVSMIMLLLTRPIVKNYMLPKMVRTNADKIIGTQGIVTEEINNLEGKGAIKVDGKEWTARNIDEDAIISVNTLVTIVEIKGVKAIVKKI